MNRRDQARRREQDRTHKPTRSQGSKVLAAVLACLGVCCAGRSAPRRVKNDSKVPDLLLSTLLELHVALLRTVQHVVETIRFYRGSTGNTGTCCHPDPPLFLK